MQKLLTTQGVKTVTLKYSSNTYTITKDNIYTELQKLAKAMTDTSKETNELDRKLSSLYSSTSPKKFTIQIDLQNDSLVKSNSTSTITYTVTFNSNFIISQQGLYDMSKKGLDKVNTSTKKHFRVSRDKNDISVSYNSNDENINVMCLFAKSKSVLFISVDFCDTDTAEKSYTNSGGTGMNDAIGAFFNDARINKVEIQKADRSLTKELVRTEALELSNDNFKLAEFTSELVSVLDIKSDYKPKGPWEPMIADMYKGVIELKGVKTKQLLEKSFYIRVYLDSNYAYEDGVNNEYYIHVIGSFTS